MKPIPLFSLRRNGVEEIQVHGELCLDTGDKIIQFGSPESAYPARSLLKPFQFLATWDGHGPLSTRQTACLGSLSASEPQAQKLRQWYADPQWSALQAALRLPPSYPMDEFHRVHLKERGEKPNVMGHMCFSKHMGILEGCRKRGWLLEGYNQTDHPYHCALLGTLSEVLNRDLSHVPFVVDGCTLPTPVLPMREIAQLYRSLVGAEESSALGSLATAMRTYPEWVGGPARIDTRLMLENPGRLIAKEGADGLIGIGISPTELFPKGVGIVLKLACGYYPPLFALALRPVLDFFGLMTVGEVPRGQTLHFHYSL